ncbi:Quinohemoprotein amine dehydrogenase subunit alpha [Alteromonas macleodii]|uniref:quinohemoprotein amine dehydrogenase subunit alpha n=1 Tax=Alteromonas TaxID=226 RepID=UPI0009044099|nr:MULTISPECIES: quinohemoprotein amine dehydrogenase subunit alpha [Alteromonas]APE04969.1 quinohemoprotein amine dehydrogenase subunit alpha [Alteromonas sp. RW2A1]QPL48996.1 quinohemoprotein amine dehydrogenase subunit alpha [Alteromonas sp. B31-7]HBA56681.1 quinohemoprotein amine dehydrogenase subunit alpha [Alteromonas macleodii]HCV02281.1 quinohemoprotein amine dehydrogenase subunit alpha [Pseudoalteromonas sp.]
MLVNRLKKSLTATACSVALLTCGASVYSTEVVASESLLQQHCSGCHIEQSQDPLTLSRISYQRKTPEGWLMTIARMQTTHGLKIDGETRASLVEYLANTQGLTPSESAPYRYILERRLNHIENKQPELEQMCARCHSEARVGLQRRDKKDWEHLVNFHLGQWPSTEYSAMGRDRKWFEIAINETVPFLANKYALNTQDWVKWQDKSKVSPGGNWRITGHMPSKGAFQGTVALKDKGNNQYAMTFTGTFDDGESLSGTGSVLVYSGYEWRGSLTVGDKQYRQVFALNEAGDSLSGRMFLNGHEDIGVDISGHRSDKASILSLSPTYIKAGETLQVSIRGSQLSGDVTFSNGLTVVSEVSRTADEIIVQVKAPKMDASAMSSTVNVGKQSLDNALVAYQQVDQIKVSPAYAVARVGEGGGSQPKVTASFEAKAFAAGQDGEVGTDDDVYIGLFPASWSVKPFDAQSEADEDVKFAGVINPETGVFTPGDAGPNPDRKYGTNNAGRLAVVAKLQDGKNILEGQGELIVTVQRWNNPPIK